MIATLILSLGVPMIRGGDEISHTQRGNNNAYCQDNETTWYQWSNVTDTTNTDVESVNNRQDFLDFVKQCIKIRKSNPNLQRHTYNLEHKWLNPGGHEMREDEWANPHNKSVGVLIPGMAVDDIDSVGHKIKGETLLIIINAHWETVDFIMPYKEVEARWTRILDTSSDEDLGTATKGGDRFGIPSRSLIIFALEKYKKRRARKNMDSLQRYYTTSGGVSF